MEVGEIIANSENSEEKNTTILPTDVEVAEVAYTDQTNVQVLKNTENH